MKFVRLWLPVFFYAGLIFVFSSQPQPKDVGLFMHSDKIIHLFEYAILGVLLMRAFGNSDYNMSFSKCLIASVALAFLYGVLDEFHQYFVPTRNANLQDALFDGIGALLGAIVYRVRNIKLYKRHGARC